MDEEFGIENIVKEDVRNELKNAYTAKNLKGLRVEHNLVCYYFKLISAKLKDQKIK